MEDVVRHVVARCLNLSTVGTNCLRPTSLQWRGENTNGGIIKHFFLFNAYIC